MCVAYEPVEQLITEIPRHIPRSFAKCPSRDGRGGESAQQVLRQYGLASTARSIREGVDVPSRSVIGGGTSRIFLQPLAMHPFV